ncbi:hypothetical protein FM106_07050 [Brachybacterium faecium]|nr:hypothetical protein FM106_07050 [Brachybacterium faecium]
MSTNPYVGIVANLFAYENSMGRKFSRKIEYQFLSWHCCEFIRLRDQ